MHASVIQEYSRFDNAALMRKAKETFNAWIRNRDKLSNYTFKCISCGNIKPIKGRNYQALHYYSSGEYPALRFIEDNVHGGCLHCNHYRGDQHIRYRENLAKKIGLARFAQLSLVAIVSPKKHWSRIELIYIIEKYQL